MKNKKGLHVSYVSDVMINIAQVIGVTRFLFYFGADNNEQTKDYQDMMLCKYGEMEVQNSNKTKGISFLTILGKTTSTIMKLHDMTGSREVLILVGNGSMYNFLSDTLVEKLNLSVQSVPLIGVEIGIGDIISITTNPHPSHTINAEILTIE